MGLFPSVMTKITQVQTAGDLERFINYPYDKYRHNPSWVAPLRIMQRDIFDERKNPFFEHARMDLYLAWQNNQLVGRIAAIDDDLHNATHHDNLMFFGFFEAASADVAQSLLDKVEARARKLGRGRVRGPVNPSMNDGAGFQIDAFDSPPFVMMPQNPAEYPQYVEAAGYRKIKDLYAWLFETEKGMGERLSRLASRAAKRMDFQVRSLNMRNLQDDVNLVLDFYNSVWQDNWGQIKYTDAEARKLAKELRQIIDPRLVLFLEIDSELAGIAVCFPDLNQVLAQINSGRLFPLGFLKLLFRRRYINRARLPILGVRPQYRNKGLELILISEIYQRGAAAGYIGGECSWVLEDNEAMNKGIAAAGARLYKTYRLYQKDFVTLPKKLHPY